jgi:hypothetical protein
MSELERLLNGASERTPERTKYRRAIRKSAETLIFSCLHLLRSLASPLLRSESQGAGVARPKRSDASTDFANSSKQGDPKMTETRKKTMPLATELPTWRSRPAILRTTMALGLGLLGLTSFGRDAHATYTVRADYLWERRPMTNGSGGCRVPYTDELLSADVRNTAYQVIAYINSATPCVWEPKTSWDYNYVAIREEPAGPDQWLDWSSSSGGTGNLRVGRQQMSICHGCSGFQHLLHEMGHVMGLLHEHQRPDRDTYVDIFPYYIQGSAQQQFHVRTEGETFGLPYDPYSIMHYSGWDFFDPAAGPWCWATGCRTIKLKNGADPGPTMNSFDASDDEGLRRRYPVPKRITAMHSGKCVTISGTNATNPAVQWDCLQDGNQGWLFQWKETVGGVEYFTIESAWPGAERKCLDVQSGSQNPATPVWLWDCTGNPAQQWTAVKHTNPLNTGYTLRARHSGQCLDVAWNSQDNGASLVQSTCAQTPNQVWGFNYRPETRTREQPDPRCGSPWNPC